MHIVIFGASGGTGRCLLTQAVAQGHHVTVFQHRSSQFGKTKPHRVVQGDVLEYFDVEEAVKGQDAVLCALGPANTKGTTVLSKGTYNIITAMEKCAIRRLICETSLGVGDSRKQTPWWFRTIFIPLFLKEVFADKVVQEKHIHNSSLDWTIIRPAGLNNGKATGQIKVAFADDKKFIGTTISRADVAVFMLAQLKSDRLLRQTVGISS